MKIGAGGKIQEDGTITISPHREKRQPVMSETSESPRGFKSEEILRRLLGILLTFKTHAEN